MPTYEYYCAKCDKTFDVFQSMSDEPVKKCPDCNGKVERLISGGAGLIFKGSGFYINDYGRSSEYKQKSQADKFGGSSGCGSCSDKKTCPNAK